MSLKEFSAFLDQVSSDKSGMLEGTYLISNSNMKCYYNIFRKEMFKGEW